MNDKSFCLQFKDRFSFRKIFELMCRKSSDCAVDRSFELKMSCWEVHSMCVYRKEEENK